MRRSIYRAFPALVRALETSSPFQGFPQEEFDVAVQRAKVIIRPSLNGFQQVLVDPQEKRFSVGHRALLLVQ